MKEDITDLPEAISPSPRKVIAKPRMITFMVALLEMIEGEKVTKRDWQDMNIYGFMDKDTDNLMLRRDGKNHQWILSEGDILGEDYIVIN